MTARPGGDQSRPNIVFVMSDDHAAHAIGAYGSALTATPHLDRIASHGMRFDNAFCTNAICSPSRAAILTGTYNHVNGVTTLPAEYDARQPSFPPMLQAAGYQTAIVGKWHLGHGGVHDPYGFDYWEVLPDQGEYHDPVFLTADGSHVRQGYVTDLITDLALDWLTGRDPDRPFCLLVHHKAPHRPWRPDAAHAHLYTDAPLPLPPTFFDDHTHRSGAAAEARMRVDRDLTLRDLKQEPPPGLRGRALAEWKYQRYIGDYLRVVASVDDNVGRLIDWLDEAGLSDNTIVVYTSDQGFFLGDHGWYDKRFMYEESLRMPLLVRWPSVVPAGSSSDDLVVNVDLAQTLLDVAGVPAHPRMQGRSILPLLRGERPDDWRSAVYYRYWEHLSTPHRVRAHYGIRTRTHKLIYYYGQGLGQPLTVDEPREPEWELFDLQRDPHELHNRHDDPDHADVLADLTDRLANLQAELGDTPWPPPVGASVPAPATARTDHRVDTAVRQARPLALRLPRPMTSVGDHEAAMLQRVRTLGFRTVALPGVGDPMTPAADRIVRAAALRRMLDDADLAVCAVHGRIPAEREEYHAVFDEIAIIGATSLIASGPALVDGCADVLTEPDDVRSMADRLNALAGAAADRGITVGYHIGSKEWDPIAGGEHSFDVLWAYADPAVVAEIDVDAMCLAGQDPAVVATRLGARAESLHIRPFRHRQQNASFGSPDLHAALSASRHVAWHVVEAVGPHSIDSAAATAHWLLERGWSRWDTKSAS